MFSRLVSIYENTLKAFGVLAGVAAWCGALLVVVAVVARYLFNYGIVFAFDLTVLSMGIICFLGAIYTQHVKRHARVDVVVERLPKRVQQWLEVITVTMTLVICLVFLYWGIVMISLSIEFGTRAVSFISMPLAITQASLVIGFLFLSLVILVQLGTTVKRLRCAK
jgi:TRAP-type C4-dicarboxylate transport system permease small subunit